MYGKWLLLNEPNQMYLMIRVSSKITLIYFTLKLQYNKTKTSIDSQERERDRERKIERKVRREREREGEKGRERNRRREK